MKDQILKERLSKNLMAWPDITAFCLELRKSFLKLRHTSMDEKNLIKKLFAENVANKEKNWISKRHS
jgi:hypothetical protein